MGFLDKLLGLDEKEFNEQENKATRHDARIAACALFLEMANIDEAFSDKERQEILSILEQEYDLSHEHAVALAEAAQKQRQESLDLWHFTQLINQQYSRDEKIRVVELLWKIIFIDGKLDSHEDYLVHSLADMLNLSHSELIDAKLRILHQNNE